MSGHSSVKGFWTEVLTLAYGEDIAADIMRLGAKMKARRACSEAPFAFASAFYGASHELEEAFKANQTRGAFWPSREQLIAAFERHVTQVIDKLAGADHRLYETVAIDLNTGLRRGELLALRLSDVDLEKATLKVERSLEETKNGLRIKDPKTEESRVASWHLGKPKADTLLFAEPDGSQTPPNRLTRRWQDACVRLRLPRVSFHALRHTHASALIDDGVDVVMISRRLGHKSPIYAHLFAPDDRKAAMAIENVMTGKEKR